MDISPGGPLYLTYAVPHSPGRWYIHCPVRTSHPVTDNVTLSLFMCLRHPDSSPRPLQPHKHSLIYLIFITWILLLYFITKEDVLIYIKTILSITSS